VGAFKPKFHPPQVARTAIFATALAVLPLCASADTLTRAQAIAEAQAHNPEVRSLNAAIAAARGDVTTARKWSNPELTVAPGFRSSDAGGDQFHSIAELRQELLFPGKRELRVAVAQKNVAMQEIALLAFQNQIAARVRRAYDTLFLAVGAVGVRERRLRLARDFAEAARKRVESGVASELETTRADVDFVRAQKGLRDAQAQSASARAALNALLGRDAPGALEVTDSTNVDFPLPQQDSLFARITRVNPGLRAQLLAVDRAAAVLALERKLRSPDFMVGPSIEYLKDEKTYDLGISFPLPLWDQRKGEIATAAAEQERAVAEREKLRQEILADATAAYESTASALETLTLFTPELRQRLNAAMDAAAGGYREGRITLLSYLEMQRTFFETQSDYIDAIQSLIDARAALETAAGVSLETLMAPPER
jgi:cobalt-zinc-cadmium efflux system outer membrane protein